MHNSICNQYCHAPFAYADNTRITEQMPNSLATTMHCRKGEEKSGRAVKGCLNWLVPLTQLSRLKHVCVCVCVLEVKVRQDINLLSQALVDTLAHYLPASQASCLWPGNLILSLAHHTASLQADHFGSKEINNQKNEHRVLNSCLLLFPLFCVCHVAS